jgi:hypothetical protein
MTNDYSQYRDDLPNTGYEDECYVCGCPVGSDGSSSFCSFTWHPQENHGAILPGVDPLDMTLCTKANCLRLAPVLMRRAIRKAAKAGVLEAILA